MIADNIWDMLMGKAGKLPGSIAPEIQKLADEQGREPFTANPQSLFPDALDNFKAEMDKNGWKYGEDNEELFELAMHPEQYRAYKSGEAKRAFEEDLAKKKAEGGGLFAAPQANNGSVPAQAGAFVAQPSSMNINVNGENFRVTVSYDEDSEGTSTAEKVTEKAEGTVKANSASGEVKEITAPLEGKFYLTKSNTEKPVKPGDQVNEGDLIGYIEAMKTFNAIKADKAGKVVEIVKSNGEDVEEDDVLVLVQ